MQIIRDEHHPIMMIPFFSQHGVTRCNIKDCREKPTTVCLHEQANFGLCEQHYQSFKQQGEVKMSLDFNPI